MYTEKLFSYGTLRYERVQLANFGRMLDGVSDVLPNYALTQIEITAPDVIATSGQNEHPMVLYTGNSSDSVHGMVFDVSRDELARADAYEVSDYKRVKVLLASGIEAWVYASVGQA